MKVEDRPAEVRLERIGPSEIREPAGDADERVVHEVARLFPVPGEIEGEPQPGRGVRHVEVLEPPRGGRADTRLRPHHQRPRRAGWRRHYALSRACCSWSP